MKFFTGKIRFNKVYFSRILLAIGIIIFSGSVRIFSEEQIKITAGNVPIGIHTFFFVKMKRTGFSVVTPSNYYHEWMRRAKSSTAEQPRLSTAIMGNGFSDKRKLSRFLTEHNPKISLTLAKKIASLYIMEASAEGVNYDVAFSQMCLETGFLKFGGDVNPKQNNFCGLGVTAKGQEGLSFPSLQTGIRAHIQHLKAYASTKPLKHNVVDSRFRYVKRGSVRDIQQLTGKWAHDPHYGSKIEKLLKRLMAAK